MPDKKRLTCAALIGLALGAGVFSVWPEGEPTAPRARFRQTSIVRPGAPRLALFDASRTKAPVAVMVASGAPRLQGVSIVGARRRALLSFGGAAVWLNEGDMYDAWTLARASEARVDLVSSTETISLSLFPDTTAMKSADGSVSPE